jgi:membrane fusion protein, multidrug efflux system
MTSKPKRLKVGITTGIIIIFTIGLVWKLTSSSANQDASGLEIVRPVKTMLLAKTLESESRSFPGIVQADKEVKLSFRVGGPLIEMHAEIGQQVKAGAVIAKIDPRDFEIQQAKLKAAIQEAEANLKMMKKGARQEDLEQLEANLRASNARLLEAKLSFDRYRNLFEQKAASKSRFDSVKAAHEMAEAEVDAAKQALKKARQGARVEDVEAMEARISALRSDYTAARNALEDTILRSPFSGFIHEKLIENHETVRPGQVVVSLLDMENLEIKSTIPEEMIIRKEGFERATCEFDAFSGRQFEAAIDYIGRKTISANQSYPIGFIMERPECCTISPGMAATVTIHLHNKDSGRNIFSVPVTAVFADESGTSNVWELNMETMTVHKKPVHIDGMGRERIQLVSGIPPGTRIVTAGAKFLREGQKVGLMRKSREKKQ